MLAFFPALSLSLVAGPALRSSSRLPHARAASPTLLFLDQLILAAHSSTAHGSLEVMQTTMQTNLHHALPHLFPAPVPEVISPIEHLHALYVNSLETHYYRTTAIQATVLVGLGDLGAQLIERRATGDAYEPQRTLRMAVLGLFIAGFGTSTWLRLLEAALPGNGTPEIVVEKACLDACIWAPIANTLYLVLTPLLEGDSPAEVRGPWHALRPAVFFVAPSLDLIPT